MDLTSFRTLGRSGLVVSPFALGTMTFGAGRWGTEEDGARAILDAYAEAGGNFIDTADIYGGGRSEEMLGRWIAERSLRDRMVIATKFTWNLDPGNPNAGGNGRKNVLRAIDASLARLGTDYIDLYWSHFWDMTTPVEELLQTFTDLVRSGKIRYYALSDVPAWYATKMAVLAAERGLPGPIAIQAEYSLVERTAEREHVPLATECGMGLVPWSPLAGGFLTGKYGRDDKREGSDRLNGGNPLGSTKFTDRNWGILDALKGVATEIGCPPARAALAWTINQPRVDSLLLGASRPDQVRENVAALALDLSDDHRATLDGASALEPAFPYSGFSGDVKRSIFGGTDVTAWRQGLRR
jgi:aryl-alcohol dehydrogenase-like predicted oxidoreductase